MRFTAFAAFASLVGSAAAHATLYGVWKNGVDQGKGVNKYIRSPDNNDPIKDLRSPHLTCNTKNRVVPNSVSVKGGDKLTFEWNWVNRDDMIIDPSHKGPVLVYISDASGSEWTKIFEANHNGNEWAVDSLREAHGQHSVIIPNVPAGDYILRAEIIALHEADALFSKNSGRGAQFFPSCVQIKVTSNGPDALPKGVAIPGAYTDSSSGVFFDIYSGGKTRHATYKAPGPAVWAKAKGGDIGRVGIPGKGPVETPTAAPTSVTSKTTSSATTKTTSSVTRSTTSTSSSSPAPSAPSSAAARKWEQCGGANWKGPQTCESGSTCTFSSRWYSQCIPAKNLSNAAPKPIALWGQCGGEGYTGSTSCAKGSCVRMNKWYSQCRS